MRDCWCVDLAIELMPAIDCLVRVRRVDRIRELPFAEPFDSRDFIRF